MDLFSADLLSNEVKEPQNPSSLINDALVNLFDETIEDFLLSESFMEKEILCSFSPSQTILKEYILYCFSDGKFQNITIQFIKKNILH
jgi:hypothetical protein